MRWLAMRLWFAAISVAIAIVTVAVIPVSLVAQLFPQLWDIRVKRVRHEA